jgi:N-acetylmuramoyl-L-alanine amidase
MPRNTAIRLSRMTLWLTCVPVLTLVLGAVPAANSASRRPQSAPVHVAALELFAWPPPTPLIAEPLLVATAPSDPPAFGFRRIVIDAGHGGYDDGTVGPQGLNEKDIVLDVALRLRALILLRLQTDVVLTRETDRYIALQERARIANSGKADLFLSIHANSSPREDAAGTETYFLNPSGHAGNTESRKVAETIQRSIFGLAALSNSTARNRGAKRAPFVVLTHAEMPSILAEIGFLSNPADEFNLSLPEYRQRIAEALFEGLREYATFRDSGLGVVAQGLRTATHL